MVCEETETKLILWCYKDFDTVIDFTACSSHDL